MNTLLDSESDLRYFSGQQSTSGMLLITKGRKYLIAKDPDLARLTRFSFVPVDTTVPDAVIAMLRKLRIRKIGVRNDTISYTMVKKLEEAHIKTQDVANEIIERREIKTKQELSSIKKACSVADEAMRVTRESICPGMTERELCSIAAAELLCGSERLSFDLIVESGENCAYAHYYPTERKIRPTDLVIVDIGACVDGYHSDLTRTFCMQPDEEKQHLYDALLTARRIALDNIRPGRPAKGAYDAVGAFFKKRGVAGMWKYNLGHGIGLDVHEEPWFSKTSHDMLRDEMTFAIEPGLHKKGWGGMRIEDDYVLHGRPIKLTRSEYGLVP